MFIAQQVKVYVSFCIDYDVLRYIYLTLCMSLKVQYLASSRFPTIGFKTMGFNQLNIIISIVIILITFRYCTQSRILYTVFRRDLNRIGDSKEIVQSNDGESMETGKRVFEKVEQF